MLRLVMKAGAIIPPIHKPVSSQVRSRHACGKLPSIAVESFPAETVTSHACMFHEYPQNSQSRPSINKAAIAVRMWRYGIPPESK